MIIKNISTVMLIFLFAKALFASGKIEEISSYTTHAPIEIKLMKENYYIELQYLKPEGITQIPDLGSVGIIIEQLIVDGIKIKPKKLYFMADDTMPVFKETSIQGSLNTIEMNWETIEIKPTMEIIKQGLIFRSRSGQYIWPVLYEIPYKSTKIYLTYRIRLLINQTKNNSKKYFLTEKQTIAWEMTWP
jgi:hypothetical protein